MNDRIIVLIIVICLTIVESIALLTKVDGKYLGVYFMAIGSLLTIIGKHLYKKFKDRKKGENHERQ